jgi:membrane protein implicated in regulation of membrane protease activity
LCAGGACSRAFGRPLNFTVRSQLGSIPVITLSAIITGVILAAVGYQLLETGHLHRSSKGLPHGAVTGLEALVGTDAEVVEAFKPNGPAGVPLGRVRVGSELWKAELVTNAGRSADIGAQVRVVGVTGMLLRVECR